ncbi:complement component C7 [Pelodytes ibericus]
MTRAGSQPGEHRRPAAARVGRNRKSAAAGKDKTEVTSGRVAVAQRDAPAGKAAGRRSRKSGPLGPNSPEPMPDAGGRGNGGKGSSRPGGAAVEAIHHQVSRPSRGGGVGGPDHAARPPVANRAAHTSARPHGMLGGQLQATSRPSTPDFYSDTSRAPTSLGTARWGSSDRGSVSSGGSSPLTPRQRSVSPLLFSPPPSPARSTSPVVSEGSPIEVDGGEYSGDGGHQPGGYGGARQQYRGRDRHARASRASPKAARRTWGANAQQGVRSRCRSRRRVRSPGRGASSPADASPQPRRGVPCRPRRNARGEGSPSSNRYESPVPSHCSLFSRRSQDLEQQRAGPAPGSRGGHGRAPDKRKSTSGEALATGSAGPSDQQASLATGPIGELIVTPSPDRQGEAELMGGLRAFLDSWAKRNDAGVAETVVAAWVPPVSTPMPSSGSGGTEGVSAGVAGAPHQALGVSSQSLTGVGGPSIGELGGTDLGSVSIAEAARHSSYTSFSASASGAPPANSDMSAQSAEARIARLDVLSAVLILLPLLGIVHIAPAFSRQAVPVNCRWNSFGVWSDCDGCSKTQTRRRTVDVYAQFGGQECSGSESETRSCVPTRGCPIEDGCGDRFRCFSGQCISQSLVCNGDHDCEEDSADEADCEVRNKVCDTDKYPPNTELTGLGFDVNTQELKNSVIHTKSFGGKCRKVFNADNRHFYRLSENVLTYTFKVEAKNDFSYDFYNSSWSYVYTTSTRVRTNYDYRKDDDHTSSNTREKSYQLMVIQNYVEVAQFLNNDAEFLALAEPFWKELFNLPSVYEYTAYRKLIERYGTHFLQSGSLGGEYNFLFFLESEKMTKNGVTITDMHKCTSSSTGFLFFKSSSTECKKLTETIKSSSGSSSKEVRGTVKITGGEPKFVGALNYINLDNPAANRDRYAAWAGSISNLPSVIKQKLTPLHELVREIPCSAVKRYYLKRAIEEYMNEENVCKCKPCQNKGQPVIVRTKCECLCKPYTYGSACESGGLVQDEPGVIDGSWSCWSSWSACLASSGRRVRNRVCNNPAPSGGGKRCNGDSIETQQCEDDELEHYRTVEPHCFEIPIEPTEFCPPPPSLENGHIKDAGSSFYVGKRVTYACNEGYALVGDPIAECRKDLTWHREPIQCKRVMCSHPVFPSNVKTVPDLTSYQVGDKISISCPVGFNLEGPDSFSCRSSLSWYPDPENVQCKRKVTAVTPIYPGTICKPWEKLQDSKCTCKMPYECGSSLAVCAIDGRNNKNIALTVCKMHALQCLGRKYTLTQQENCKFPEVLEKSCDSCDMWETCSDKTKTCLCRESQSCGDEGISICVQLNGKKQTMTECEAAVLKCQGENVTIVNISPCDT